MLQGVAYQIFDTLNEDVPKGDFGTFFYFLYFRRIGGIFNRKFVAEQYPQAGGEKI